MSGRAGAGKPVHGAADRHEYADRHEPTARHEPAARHLPLARRGGDGAHRAPLRFAILGHGAIADELLRLVAELGDAASSLEFVGTVSRDPASLETAIERADVVVEAASVGAVHECGPRIVAAGLDLVVASVGAFADPAALPRLRASGSGHVHLTSGAIGGLDLLAAAGRTGGLDGVLVQSRKLPSAIVQHWMSTSERAELFALTEPRTIFAGTPAEAIARFPASLNVAVAVGLAVGDPSLVRVELVADPLAALTTHTISAAGTAGEYSFTIKNSPLPARSASSGLTARALVADLLRLADAARSRTRRGRGRGEVADADAARYLRSEIAAAAKFRDDDGAPDSESVAG